MHDERKHEHIIHASALGPSMYGPEQRLAILCEGKFTPLHAKVAQGMLRYCPNPIVAIIDSTRAGQSVREVTGIDRDTPIVATVEEAISLGAQVLAIGISPTGGLLPEEWRQMIITCLESGLDIAAGLHTRLGDDPHFAELAEENDCFIYDVRRPPKGIPVAKGACRHLDGKRIAVVVGTDCASGKMSVALELTAELKRRGVRAKFVPTGQTGIFIAGWGIAIDAVVSDFTAGATEIMVLEAARDADVIVVEGQGSLLHPGYSGVTLSLIHGAMPTDLIFAHPATPVIIEEDYGITPPPMTEMIRLHEHIVEPIRPAKVRGIAVNTSTVSPEDGDALMERLRQETGLPVTDVVRCGAGPLADLFV